MLVLTRRVGEEGEEIVIGGDVRVAVLGARGCQIRLEGVAAPSVRALRQELANRPLEPADTPLVLPTNPQPSLSDSRIMAGLIQIAR